MQDTEYSLSKSLPDTSYEQAIERVVDALKEEGFGVLTEIDVRATFKQKLDVDFKPYIILGACNPQLAHRALSMDESIGLLLPCNVVVAARDGGAEVAIARPRSMLGIAELETLRPVADEAEERLARVLERL